MRSLALHITCALAPFLLGGCASSGAASASSVGDHGDSDGGEDSAPYAPDADGGFDAASEGAPSGDSSPVVDASQDASDAALEDTGTDAGSFTPAAWSLAWRGIVDDLHLATSPQGDLVVAGTFSSALDTGSPGQSLGTQSVDWFIAKIPAGGGPPLWLRHVSGFSTSMVSAVAVGPDGSIYVVGSAGWNVGDVDFHGMPGAPVGADNPTVSVLRLDPAGGYGWARSDLIATGVAVAPSGDVWVTGTSLPGDGSTKGAAVVSRYDQDGNVVTQRSFGSAFADTRADDVGVDSSGAPVVVFNAPHPADFGAGPQTGIVTMKLDSALSTLWSSSCKLYGALSAKKSLAVGDGDRVAVGGTGTVVCGSGNGSALPGTPGFVVLYDASGHLAAASTYAGSFEVTDVAFDPGGRVYFAGSTGASTDFGVGSFVAGSDLSGANPFAWVLPPPSATPPAPVSSVVPLSAGRAVIAMRRHGTVDLGNGPLLGFGENGLVIAEIAP